jgi:hypothetical protein
MAEREQLHLSENTLRKAILDFVKRNPECLKEDVVNHCIEAGIGSRVTLFRELQELIEEKVLDKGKKRENNRSYKLTLNSENLLIIIPGYLEEISIQFKTLINTIRKISKTEDDIRSTISNSMYGDIVDDETDYKKIRNSLQFIPFIILDVINDVITFSFLFILPKKIIPSIHHTKLYSSYFERLNNMYSYLSSELSWPTTDNINSFSERSQHLSYLKTKKYSTFEKVCYLVYVCYFYGIENNLYKILDLLWLKNIESVGLMYDDWDLQYLFSEYRRRSPLLKTDPNYNSRLEWVKKSDDYLLYRNNMLNKIHDAINCYILLDEGFYIDDKRRFFYPTNY